MRFPCYNRICVLLMATIHAHARLHMRTCLRPFTRMVAINKLKTLCRTGNTHYKTREKEQTEAIEQQQLPHHTR